MKEQQEPDERLGQVVEIVEEIGDQNIVQNEIFIENYEANQEFLKQINNEKALCDDIKEDEQCKPEYKHAF